MAYVDLNAVRAAMADSLETSDFTSIQQRIHEYSSQQKATEPTRDCVKITEDISSNVTAKSAATASKRYSANNELEHQIGTDKLPKAELMKFDGSSHTDINTALPFTLVDYFELVDSTGQQLRADKRGAISEKSCRLLASLGVNADHWLDHIEQFGLRYANGVGSVSKLASFANHFRQSWVKGVVASSKLYRRV
ncbi:hypothetical protein [Halioxenophilus aromaticivorans]|uniref:Uncharacterized protein n=1 Tax=Halioxenophilus aromaticivorans TaxID=1306992 RepID=A0AAV3TXG2_9ALTE